MASPEIIKKGKCGLKGRKYCRKTNKPLIERKRRARINESLSILKKLVVDCNNNKIKMKMKKSDILEITVAHLQRMQDEHVCFSDGYQVCSKAIFEYLKWKMFSEEMLKELEGFLQNVWMKLDTHCCAHVFDNSVMYPSNFLQQLKHEDFQQHLASSNSRKSPTDFHSSTYELKSPSYAASDLTESPLDLSLELSHSKFEETWRFGIR